MELLLFMDTKVAYVYAEALSFLIIITLDKTFIKLAWIANTAYHNIRHAVRRLISQTTRIKCQQ